MKGLNCFLDTAGFRLCISKTFLPGENMGIFFKWYHYTAGMNQSPGVLSHKLLLTQRGAPASQDPNWIPASWDSLGLLLQSASSTQFWCHG